MLVVHDDQNIANSMYKVSRLARLFDKNEYSSVLHCCGILIGQLLSHSIVYSQKACYLVLVSVSLIKSRELLPSAAIPVETLAMRQMCVSYLDQLSLIRN